MTVKSKVIGENEKGKTRDLYQEIQERKEKFTSRLGMLNDQQGNTLSDHEKIKGKWKWYTENLHRRDKRMTDISEEDSCQEQLIILESENCLESIGKK